MRRFHVTLAARSRYRLDEPLFGFRGGMIQADIARTRRLAARMNEARARGDADGAPTLTAGELHALGILHELFHAVVERFDRQLRPGAIDKAVATVEAELGEARVAKVLDGFDTQFPDGSVPQTHAPTEPEAVPEPGSPEARAETIEELLLIALANGNPAAEPFRELFDDRPLARSTDYPLVMARLEALLDQEPSPLPGGVPLLQLLRAPAQASPTSLAGQLRYIRSNWAGMLGDLGGLLDRLLVGLDVLAEEERGLHLRFGGGFGGFGGQVEAPSYGGLDAEPERFSSDSEWMPRVVMIAKSTYVWLDQLSRKHQRDISRLDQVPDEELDRLASWGVTGLWLIGLWQRSEASERIKRLRGNPDAVASAYSLDDYRIADDLGGEGAFEQLKARAWARGIRMASDMVPNHMGIDSQWVVDHPEWFLSLPDSPYPSYTFGGPDLSSDERVGIFLEDHYYDNSDAAVVFRRLDRWTGENRFVYHGNDGTSFPWNDTAQLDYLKAEVREAVIQTILNVARRSPIIRFDAAMVLAKKHVQRLWYPEPGSGGAIPSRAEHAIPKAAFDAAMPTEFWREVVDRVAAEVPDTLLLAEAFWLLEGYFVRTLGMHRVYNSAFMHMLRDEDNAGYRRLIKETLEFDPEILKRYVNFMSNPDEKTAVEQFGKGDKYFGVASVLATIPGLPMLGHGQVEGFGEKYGMEFRRATLDEQPDPWLAERHERELFPVFHRRGWFAGAEDFTLFDFVRDDGSVDEDVLVYANGRGPTRSLVVYHNRFASTAGRIRDSAAFAVKQPDGSKRLERRTLADALSVAGSPSDELVAFRDARSGLEYLRSAGQVRDGLWLQLDAYQGHVFWEFRTVADTAGVWRRLADHLGGRGVPSLEDALREQELEPVYAALRAALAPASDADAIDRFVAAVGDATGTGTAEARSELAGTIALRRGLLDSFARTPHGLPHEVRDALGEPWHRAVLAAWTLLEGLGRLARNAMVGPTSRAWFDELRLAPVVAGALRGHGLDEGAAWSATERVRVLLDVARPTNVGGRSTADRARRLATAWLDTPSTRAFLRVNRWEGEEWFDRDAWRELADWTMLLDVLEGRLAKPLVTLAKAIANAGDQAAYNVERLRTLVSTDRGAIAQRGASQPSRCRVQKPNAKQPPRRR